MPQCPARMKLSGHIALESYFPCCPPSLPYLSIEHLRIHFNRPTQLAFAVMSPPGSSSIYRRVAETCVGIFVIVFSALEIEEYLGINDQYPIACNIANTLVLFVFFLSHSLYRNLPWSRESRNGQVEATGNEKSFSFWCYRGTFVSIAEDKAEPKDKHWHSPLFLLLSPSSHSINHSCFPCWYPLLSGMNHGKPTSITAMPTGVPKTNKSAVSGRGGWGPPGLTPNIDPLSSSRPPVLVLPAMSKLA